MTPSSSSSFVPLPEYWSKDDIEQGDDGYFRLKNNKAKPDEVLLLHSTEKVLKVLNPGNNNKDDDDWESILFEEGWKDMSISTTNEDEDDNDDNDEQSVNDPYQSLQREATLTSRLQAAVHDIQQCRHRVMKPDNKNKSNDNNETNDKKQQQDDDDGLEQQGSDMEVDNDEDDEAEEMDLDGASLDGADHGDNDDDNEENNAQSDETELVRMIRTLNSIRALFPHLIPMLNHKRRNDRTLKIQDVKWKKRKRRGMCWILGKYVFDTSTGHSCIAMHIDVHMILRGYMDTNLAEKVSADPQSPLEFWQTQWIPEVMKRMTPKIMNPLDILLLLLSSESSKDNVNVDEEETIMKNAQQCDQELFATETNVNKATFETRKKYRQCIDDLRDYILKSLKKRFPKARLTMYGSCLSNLSLGGSDVDLSLWIPEANALKEKFQSSSIDIHAYQREMKKNVFKVFHFLNNRRDCFQGMQPITRARVPVVKGTKLRAGNPHSPDGSIDFDICFLNDIAVANSNLLREYSLIDSRVRDVMIQVKRFCKFHGVNSSANGTISSYAWNIMCIFYLQCIGFIPNLQDPALMEKVKQTPSPKGNYWHSVDGLDTFFLKWKEVEKVWQRPACLEDKTTTTVSLLLYGFFEFYNHRFAHGFHTISIRQASMKLSKLHGRAFSANQNPKLGKRLSALSIEDPFEQYESHRPHDLGSHSFNDDKIIQCLMDGEEHLRKLLTNGVTDELGAPWKPSKDGEKQDETKLANARKGTNTARKKGQNGQKNKNQGQGNQGNGRNNSSNNQNKNRNNNNNNRNRNRNRQPKQPNRATSDNPDNNNNNNKNNNNSNGNNKKKPPPQKRKNGPKGGPAKRPEEKVSTNGANKDQS